MIQYYPVLFFEATEMRIKLVIGSTIYAGRQDPTKGLHIANPKNKARGLEINTKMNPTNNNGPHNGNHRENYNSESWINHDESFS
ncbi:hypothetical protein KP509_04G070600 [Ceratopteris richardii]|nr:hypothetical protein KP509_04G070600 [Ceratopteris richardii]